MTEAIEAAKPGDRILVRPGLYEESLVVDKPLEIIGDGPLEDIMIRGRDTNVLEFRASIGRVANLTLRQAGDENQKGVLISQGRLDLEGCDVSSLSGACVYIVGGADPRLRRNKIHDGRQAGIDIYDGGLGTLEDNEITGNGREGVVIVTGGNPVLRRNQIRDNGLYGVFAGSSGSGTLEDNDITGNGGGGVTIRTGGNPTIRGNRINRNEYQAVWVSEHGKGVMEDNDLTGNGRGAWLIDVDCEPNVTRARNKE